ncbi:ZmpA/ZmpB/ZmpC family metallo-endopeptidase [Streptococcus suis]|uniref:ZmpA/ZmpB/ZmpC family metallo-endopeptidase n=1 Tax=Streptococcus suis TaxID=1307 RepID=UPI003F000463
MKNIFGEKRQRFGFRKLSIGLVSAAVASLFFASSVAAAPSASAQSINYSYVTEQELTDAEKELIIRDLPGLAQETDANYYLIYRPATGTASTPSTSSSQVLPNTGSVETGLLVAGGVSLLLLAVRFGKKGKKELAGVILLTATGASFLGPASSALTSQILAQYNHAIEISAGQALPAPAEIDGYVYVGYLKDSKAIEQTTLEEEKTAEFPASEGIRTETIVNKTEAIPFEIQTVENPQLSEGTERVLQEGQDGERTVTIKQVHSKGQIISEEEISSTVTKTAVPKIVEVGTKQATDDIVTEVPDTAPSHELPTLQITEEVSTYTESIPFETQEVADDTLLEGTRQIVQEGKAGQKTIETKKTYIDGILVKTETVSETINQTAAPQIIHVGTKPVTSVPDSAPSHEVPTISLTEETLTHTEAIAFDVQEIYDANLAEGSREVEQKGQAGVRTIETKNYYADGVLIKSEQVSDVVTKAPVAEVVRVGTKTADVLGVENVVATEELPFETTVTETEELYVGEEKVVNEGKVGSKEVTTTYQTINGVRQPNPTVIEKVLEEPTTKEVLKGTKPIEGTETETNQVEITFETEYVDDPTLLEGKTKVVTAGVNGSKTVTTTYQTIKGVRQENPTVTEEITKQPVKQVIARGTKVEKVPQVIITDLVENDDAKSATISYKLTDETANFQRAVALLYDNTGALVQEQAITDPNGQLTLENLDFYTDYTVKTKIFYTIAEQEQSSEQEAVLESMRKFDLVYKKIEIKDIDAVTVYRRKNGSYIGQEFLEELPTSTDELFIKVTSDRFKEVYLPVSSIEETTLNGKAVFKLVSSFDELVQDKDAQYVANREFYIPKMATDANTYTSFKALIDAMKANPKGTFKLGAHLDASEVPVGDVASYVTTFSGQLIGANDGHKFAIHNLKAPLFLNLYGTVENIDLKNINLNTSFQERMAAIAHYSDGNTRITDVSVEGSIRGVRDVAGLIHTAYNTVFRNVSFKGTLESYGTDATTVGGILGHGVLATVIDAKVDASISLPGTVNQIVGGVAGRASIQQNVRGVATLQNVRTKGRINTTETGAVVGTVLGINQSTVLPHTANIANVINEMTGAPSVVGQAINMDKGISNTYSTFADTNLKVTQITATEAAEKVTTMTGITTSLEDSVPLNLNNYSVDYLTLKQAQADHATAYYNMEKILPFYNKELLVYYGNKIATDDKLNKVRLLDVVPMKDNAVVADVYAEKANINRIMLHYADGTVDYKTVSYLEDFKNNHVVKYTISGTDLIYTPESFLNDRSSLVNDLVSSLSTVVLDSDAMKAVVNYPTKLDANRQTGTAKDFYFSESFDQVKANLESNVRKILVASLNGQGQASEAYIKEKITDNKEAFLLGLTYLNRWYDINYGDVNTKDLTIFEPDFFGNDAASALDLILAIGNGGYDMLRAHNNVSTYASAIGKQNKQASLFDMVEAYRKLFLPNLTDNEWFKQTTKAYVVESKSQVAEAAAKQDAAEKHSKYALAVYDKITNPTWGYRQMLLPLLTLPQEDIFIISNMNTLAIGSYEHYVDDYKDPAKRDSVRQLVDKAAIMQRDNADFWYKILDEENRDKLFRTVLNNEGFKTYGPDGQAIYRNLLADVDAIQDYYGPINKWYAEGATKTAYANGKETFYVTYNMMDNYGTTLYSHEMVHNQDGSTYLHGYGRRIGQGMEVYADGLLQNVSSVDKTILGFNAFFESDAANRVHVGDPRAHFNSEADFNEYFHNQFDVLYLLDYIEGMTVLEKPSSLKKDWFLKLENYYIQENGKNTHAGNRMTTLTEEEAAKLTTFDDLINGSIIDRYGYQSVKYNTDLQRNGYYSVPMFAGNYSALSNPNGSPGDFMFRRMAFELIAAKGYTDGFIPYASNQLSDYVMSQNSVTYDTWNKKNTGLITDKHVFDHVFNGQYASWEEFKKAMFMERVDKAQAGKLKPFTIQYELGVANSTKEVRIASYDDLQRLIREAIDADIQNKSYGSDKSRLSTLKIKIYQALMNSTNDFRISIFNP